jgi:hypothetical protein
MIVCPNTHPEYPDDWLIVKQSDHDDHSGFIAAHLDWSKLWQPWDRRLLILAAAMHDTGSAMWEDYPLIDPQGNPWTFWTMPADDHIELHKIGVAEARKVHPYVALLISMHVEGIHRDRLHIDPQPNRWHIPEDFTPKVNAFVAEQQAIQRDLRAQLLNLGDDALCNDYKVNEMIDILSTQLSACGLAAREMVYVPDAHGAPFTLSVEQAGPWEMRMSPFLFAGDRFECPCIARRVPKRVYRDHNEFREAWYAAPMMQLPYAFVR